MDVEDYLNLDRNSKDVRYEYLDGELTMLGGGSVSHSVIIANLTGILYNLLLSSRCCTYNSDIRLQLSQTRYVYPDVAVSCDQQGLEQEDEIHHPCVIFEVLSPSTELVDRGRKFTYYRECPSIQEYIMVDSQRVQVEIYHREGGRWTLNTLGLEDTLVLESIGVQFPITAIYQRVKLL